MLCGVVTCLLDAWICAVYGGAEGKVWGHVGMGVVTGW